MKRIKVKKRNTEIIKKCLDRGYYYSKREVGRMFGINIIRYKEFFKKYFYLRTKSYNRHYLVLKPEWKIYFLKKIYKCD